MIYQSLYVIILDLQVFMSIPLVSWKRAQWEPRQISIKESQAHHPELVKRPSRRIANERCVCSQTRLVPLSVPSSLEP